MERLAAFAVISSILLGAAVGCSFRQSRANPVNWFKAPVKEVQAPQPTGFLSRASDSTAGRLGPLFTVGAMLVAAGVIGGIIMRSAGFGGSVAGTGLSLIATGVLFTEYPWIVLLAAIAGLCLIVYAGWLLVNGQKQSLALSVIAAAVEDTGKAGQEVKDKIRDYGTLAVNSVKEVITPIKANLK